MICLLTKLEILSKTLLGKTCFFKGAHSSRRSVIEKLGNGYPANCMARWNRFAWIGPLASVRSLT